MEVLMYDGSNMTKVIESHTVEAGKSVKFFITTTQLETHL